MLDAAHVMLDRIEQVLPKGCEKYMVGGNHEQRWHDMRVKHAELPPKISNTIRRLTSSWGVELRLTQRGWNWCEYNGMETDTGYTKDHFKLGKIVYTHGKFIQRTTSAKLEAEQHPGHNVIYGHTHSRRIHNYLDYDRKPIESESIGTLSQFDLAYLRGKKPTDWVHGFMHVYTRKSGLFQKVFTHILDGKFVANGRKYGEHGMYNMRDERRSRDSI